MGIGLAVALEVLAATADYSITFLGERVGHARLELTAGPGGEARYAFDAAIALSGKPCLWSRDHEIGAGHAGDPVLDEELFLAFASDIGVGCRAVTGRAGLGRGCWGAIAGAERRGTLFGEPVLLELADDGLPLSLRYTRLGIAYARERERGSRGAPSQTEGCGPRQTDEGVPAPGAEGVDGRALASAHFELAGQPLEVRSEERSVPPRVARALQAVRARRLPSCQEVAAALDAALAGLGLEGRAVIGLLLDEGRFYPHAWNEVRLGGAWVAVDAAVGHGWADAGRVRAGLEGDFASGLRLLELMRDPPRLVGGH